MRLSITVLAISVFLIVAVSEGFVSSVRAANVQILSHTGYLDSSNYYHVVGEVEDVESQAVNSVVVRVTFYDSKSTVIAYRFDSTMLNIILAGRKSPFDIALSNSTQSALVDHYSINLTYNPTISVPLGLQILDNHSYTDNSGQLHVAGDLKNIGSEEAVSVKLVVTYYDKTGKVAAAKQQFIDPENADLDQSQVAAFDIFLEDPSRASQVASYELSAESSQYEVTPEFPTVMWALVIMVTLETAMITRKIRRETEMRAVLPKKPATNRQASQKK